MSSIHVLAGSGTGNYSVAVHVATPVGNNAAGIPWSTCMKNSGRAVSSMVTGAGPGQITTTELAQITAGTLLEGFATWQDDPSLTDPQRIAAVTQVATQLANEMLAAMQSQLKYYGYAQ